MQIFGWVRWRLRRPVMGSDRVRWAGAVSGWQLRPGVLVTARQLRPACRDAHQRQVLAWVWKLGLYAYVWERLDVPRPLLDRFMGGCRAAADLEMRQDARIRPEDRADIERHVKDLLRHFHDHLDDQHHAVPLSVTAGTAGLWLQAHGAPSNIRVMTYLAATISQVSIAHANVLRQLPALDAAP